MQGEEQPDWDFFILKTVPARLFREWALGNVFQEFKEGVWIDANLAIFERGFYPSSSGEFVKVTEKNRGKKFMDDLKFLAEHYPVKNKLPAPVQSPIQPPAPLDKDMVKCKDCLYFSSRRPHSLDTVWCKGGEVLTDGRIPRVCKYFELRDYQE